MADEYRPINTVSRLRMRIRVSRFSLLAVLAALMTLFSSHSSAASAYASEVTEPPDEEMSLPHFWRFSVGDTEFGIREWRYSGNPTSSKRPRSYTTVFYGWGESDVRLPAYTVLAIGIIGLSTVCVFAAGFSRLRRVRV